MSAVPATCPARALLRHGQVAEEPDNSIDLVDLLVTKVATGEKMFLGPGATGSATVPAGAFGAVQMQPDRTRSLSRVALDKLFGKAFEALGPQITSDPAVRQVLVQMMSCAYSTWNAGQTSGPTAGRQLAQAIFGCFDYGQFYLAVNHRLTQLVEKGLISDAAAGKVVTGLLDVRDAVKYLEFGQIAVDVTDSAVWGSLSDSPVLIEHYAAKSTRDELGRVVRAQCLSPYLYAWRIDMNCQNAAYTQQEQSTGGGGATGLPLGKIVRNTNGNAWFVASDDRTMQPIEDPRHLRLSEPALRSRLGGRRRRAERLSARLRAGGCGRGL